MRIQRSRIYASGQPAATTHSGGARRRRAAGSPALGRSRATVPGLACGLHQRDERGRGKPKGATRFPKTPQRRRATRRGGDERRRIDGERRSRRARAPEHLQVAPVAPYQATEARERLLDDGRRRKPGFAAAARTETAAARSARVRATGEDG
jgi:hypothetical protein